MQDVAYGNTVIVTPRYANVHHPPFPLWKPYMIDFGESRQLNEGPGKQLPVELPASQYQKLPGMTSMDPYSWDVYCVGKLCEDWFWV